MASEAIKINPHVKFMETKTDSIINETKKMRAEVKTDLEEGIKNWKIVHFKPRYKCTLKELQKKMETAKHLIYTLTLLLVIILVMNIQVYIDGKMSVFLTMLLVFSAIAVYDETQNYWNLQMFLYWKEREMKNG